MGKKKAFSLTFKNLNTSNECVTLVIIIISEYRVGCADFLSFQTKLHKPNYIACIDILINTLIQFHNHIGLVHTIFQIKSTNILFVNSEIFLAIPTFK